MAFIEEISPGNLSAFDDLIPDILKERFVEETSFHFYGISESNEAVGCIALIEKGDEAEIKYMYILPFLRGTGIIDHMLMTLFLDLRDRGYRRVIFKYIREEYEGFKILAKRFLFDEIRSDKAYFRFKAEEIKKCPAASYQPKGIIRLKYLPDEKKEQVFKLIKKNYTMSGETFSSNADILPYSMVYVEHDQPRGALLVERPTLKMLPTSDDIKKFPEPGAFDLMIFFVGTTSLKAPLYLLSGLCKVLDTEISEKATLTGYFAEGHVTRLLEGTLGIKGSHEILASLDLDKL